jgi:hypothetical protein
MAWESKVMEFHAGFCCWGLGVRSGLHWAVGTNENEGEGFTEGKEVRDKKLDYLNH